MSSKININLGLANVLTVIFVIAKLTGAIHWSWWLVFLPTIISVGLGLTILCGGLLFLLIAAVIAYWIDRH